MPWYAIYTKPRWEKKVHEALTRKGIESYCPLNRVVKQWSDRKKKIEIPLFSSYIFVNIDEKTQTDVRMTPGVVNLVYWLGKPAVIKDTEIEALKNFVASYESITVEQYGYKEGDSIIIDSGIFKGQAGIIKKLGKHKVELVLETLQLKLVVNTSDRAPVTDQ